MRHTGFNLPRSVACICLLLLNACFCAGCSGGDDPATLAMIEKLHPRSRLLSVGFDEEHKHITRLAISIDAKSRPKILELLPRIGGLKHLEVLQIGGDAFEESDLELFPPLPKLKEFSITRGDYATHSNLTDAGLEYISSMTSLKELWLRQSKVVGPGLAHLKGFHQLEHLDLSGTPLDDSAIPHIAANFPKLRHLNISQAKVAPDDLMQLVDLHWLKSIRLTIVYAGQQSSESISRIKDDEQRTHLLQKQRETLHAIKTRFNKAHLASKQKARTAGIDVPLDSRPSFRTDKSTEMDVKAGIDGNRDQTID